MNVLKRFSFDKSKKILVLFKIIWKIEKKIRKKTRIFTQNQV